MSKQRKQSTNQGKTASKSKSSFEFQIAQAELTVAKAELKILQLQAAELPVQRHAPVSTTTSHDQPHGKRRQEPDTKECVVCKKHFEPEKQHFTKCPQCFGSESPMRARGATEGKKSVDCRYGDGCTNERCTFAHHNDCKFGSDCKKADCAYRHPRSKDEDEETETKSCRFGDECTKDGCTFSHPAVAASRTPTRQTVSYASSSAMGTTLNAAATSFTFQAPQRVLAASSTLKSVQPQKCKMGVCGSRAENDGYCRTHSWVSDSLQ